MTASTPRAFPIPLALTALLVVSSVVVGCKEKKPAKPPEKPAEKAPATSRDKQVANKDKAARSAPKAVEQASAAILARRLAVKTQARVIDEAFFKMMGEATRSYLALVYAPVLKGSAMSQADQRWLDKRLRTLVNTRITAQLEHAINGFFSADELRAILGGKKSATAQAKMPRWPAALRAAVEPFKLSIRRQLRSEYGRRLPGDDGAKIAMALDHADRFVDGMRPDRLQQLVSGMTIKRLAKAGKTLRGAELERLQARIAGVIPTMRVTVTTEALAHSAKSKRADYEKATFDAAALEKVHRDGFGKWIEKTVTGLVGEFQGSVADGKATKEDTEAARARFMMVVEAGFYVKSRGVIATGKVLRGMVSAGDVVAIVGFDKPRKVKVLGLEASRRILKTAYPGTNVGLLLDGIKPGDIKRGHVLAAPGTIDAHSQFNAKITLRSAKQGGPKKPVGKGWKPQLRFWNAAVTGAMVDPANGQLAAGASGEVNVRLAYPIAMQVGTRFEVRAGSDVIGVGSVSELAGDPPTDHKH